MKSKNNPFVHACLYFVFGIASAHSASYEFGSSTPFTLTATQQGRVRQDFSSSVFNADNSAGIYDRDLGPNALCDITYSNFDLSSLVGKIVVGDVQLNYVVNATWGGDIVDGVIGTANGAWTGIGGSAVPNYTLIGNASPLNQSSSTGDTASWVISNASFSALLADPQNFHGLVITGGNGSSAHFSGQPTLTGRIQQSAITVLNATDWDAAVFDDPSSTLFLTGNSDVRGGDISILSGSTLSVGDSATLGGGMFPGAITNHGMLQFSTTSNQTLAGPISGTGSLSHSGPSILTLTGTNTYSGTTTITSGTLQVGDGGASGSLGTGSVINDGAIHFNLSSNADVTSSINGSGSLTKSGTGTLTFWVGNGYSGTTTVESGTLALAAANDSVLYSSGLIINDGGTVSLQNWNPMGTLASPFGITPVTIHAGGVMTMNSEWSVNIGALTLNGGELSSGGFFTAQWGSYYLNGDVTVTGGTSTISAVEVTGLDPRTFHVEAGSTLLVTGNFSNRYGEFGLIKTGEGTITLSGANTYVGNTAVEGGMLELSSTGQLAFVLTDTGNNQVSGPGSANFRGTFAINTAAVSGSGNTSWTLASVTSQSFDPSFSVAGFAEQPDGVSWTMSDAKGTWTFSETSGTLTLAAPSASDFDNWLTNNGVTGGASGDDDGDGLKNFDEYAFGLNPKLPASANPLTSPLDPATGTFSYQRRKSSLATGLTFTVQTSSDLLNWTTDTAANQSASDIASTDNESVSVTLGGSKPLAAAKWFVRVVATSTTP